MDHKDGWSTAASALGVVGAAAMALGAAGAWLGLAPPDPAFRFFGLGLLLGLLALLVGGVALWRTRAAAGRAGRGRALLGALLGAAALAVVLVASAPGWGLPAINDITTDPDDPPRFEAAGELEDNAGEDLSYPGDSFAQQQRGAYPDLAPIPLDAAPDRALERAERAARELGWTVVAVDPEAGRLEAHDASAIFRFVDDVVVRVRPGTGGGSVVDVRSRSRDGRGDLGVNARRIRAFRDALAATGP